MAGRHCIGEVHAPRTQTTVAPWEEDVCELMLYLAYVDRLTLEQELSSALAAALLVLLLLRLCATTDVLRMVTATRRTST